MMNINENEILVAQENWGKGIVEIGDQYSKNLDYESRAIKHIKDLYAYEFSEVLFKPTKVSKVQFRSTFDEALSYFVATNRVCEEDTGFAIEPWLNVRFENSNIIIFEKTALAMGNYFFTNAESKITKVEYTFGYIKSDDNRILINLHHSSLPYTP
ncbi:hypothetical protein N9V35_00555 [bacterium]|nr:hypothetical protein [bacterium]